MAFMMTKSLIYTFNVKIAVQESLNLYLYNNKLLFIRYAKLLPIQRNLQ